MNVRLVNIWLQNGWAMNRLLMNERWLKEKLNIFNRLLSWFSFVIMCIYSIVLSTTDFRIYSEFKFKFVKPGIEKRGRGWGEALKRLKNNSKSISCTFLTAIGWTWRLSPIDFTHFHQNLIKFLADFLLSLIFSGILVI